MFWLASEPEAGGTALWCYSRQGSRRLDTGGSVRSRLNSYGGGAYAVMDGVVCWISEDQHLWVMDLDNGHRRKLVGTRGAVWGGVVADSLRNRWLAVRECHGRQALVAIDPDGRLSVLHDHFDFYGAPAVSCDGRELAWVSWMLPNMPWDQSFLCTAAVGEPGELTRVARTAPPGGGSVQQPQYVGNRLWVISDHQGWWQPFWVCQANGQWVWQPGSTAEADHANAPWQLGERHTCRLPSGWARVRYRNGIGELWLEREGGQERVAGSFTDFRSLDRLENDLLCIARSPDRTDSILRICPETGHFEVLFGGQRPWTEIVPVSPESIVVPAGQDSRYALQGFFYPPSGASLNRNGGKPPLILIAHGGPTSAAYAIFNPQIQYWCQRGFAVAEVNYTGSTGFGRAFRQALAGQWGLADVADMFRMADYLVDRGRADPQRLFIQGRSSGGYTALMAAMAPGSRLSGLASLYGVTDPLRLRESTHRFESGYLDWLLGPAGEGGVYWRQKTPQRMAERISCPAIFFQGGQDPVVVPEQTRSMVNAMRKVGKPAQLVWFEHEAHGFRCSGNQAQMLDRLWCFYSKPNAQ